MRKKILMLSIAILFCVEGVEAHQCRDLFAQAQKTSFLQKIKNIYQQGKGFVKKKGAILLPAKVEAKKFVPRKVQKLLQDSAHFIGKNKQYLNLTRLVKDLQTGKVLDQSLAGQRIEIPPELNLRKSLKEGRIIHLKNTKGAAPKAVVFMVSGLFNGGEKILTRNHFIREQLNQGIDIVYLEMTQGLTAAKEIVNLGASPRVIPHKEQQTLLAYYLLKAIGDLQIPVSTPKALMGHSYGGWLINRFATNPQFNGTHKPRNQHLKKMLEELVSKGLVEGSTFKGVFDHLLPLDAGLGSLHLVHPVFASIREKVGEENFTHIKKQEDLQVEQIMRMGLEQAAPQLKEDKYSLDNAVALFLGIRRETVLSAPENIPSRIRIHDIVAGKSELIPLAWHRHYFYALEAGSQGPHHRGALIIKDAPHDFLATPGVGKLIGDLLLNKLPLEEMVADVHLHKTTRDIHFRTQFPSSIHRDLLDLVLQQQKALFDQWLRLGAETWRVESHR